MSYGLGRSRWCLVILLFACLISPSLPAQEYRMNVREICRSEVAGLYLGLWNDKKLYEEQVSLSEQKLAALRGRRQLLERSLQAMPAPGSRDLPSYDQNEKTVSTRYELDAVLTQLTELDSLLALSKKKLAERTKLLLRYESLIKDIFIHKQLLRKKGDTEGLGFRIDYHKGCSEYELLCPLPAPQAQLLANIAVQMPEIARAIDKDSDSQPCERYSKIHRRGD